VPKADILQYVYFEDESGRRSAAKLLSKDSDCGEYRQLVVIPTPDPLQAFTLGVEKRLCAIG
jgi:hypothetical protein